MWQRGGGKYCKISVSRTPYLTGFTLYFRLEDGIPIQIFREIRTLQHCSESKEPGSECILRLRSYFAAGSAVVLATDFMLGDLGEIIRNWENPLRPVFDRFSIESRDQRTKTNTGCTLI